MPVRPQPMIPEGFFDDPNKQAAVSRMFLSKIPNAEPNSDWENNEEEEALKELQRQQELRKQMQQQEVIEEIIEEVEYQETTLTPPPKPTADIPQQVSSTTQHSSTTNSSVNLPETKVNNVSAISHVDTNTTEPPSNGHMEIQEHNTALEVHTKALAKLQSLKNKAMSRKPQTNPVPNNIHQTNRKITDQDTSLPEESNDNETEVGNTADWRAKGF